MFTNDFSLRITEYWRISIPNLEPRRIAISFSDRQIPNRVNKGKNVAEVKVEEARSPANTERDRKFHAASYTHTHARTHIIYIYIYTSRKLDSNRKIRGRDKFSRRRGKFRRFRFSRFETPARFTPPRRLNSTVYISFLCYTIPFPVADHTHDL